MAFYTLYPRAQNGYNRMEQAGQGRILWCGARGRLYLGRE